MSRVKRITLLLFAGLAFNAVIASAASASPAWWVNGKLLAAGAKEAIAEATEVTEPFVVKSALGSVECKSLKDVEGFIEGESKAGVKALDVGECVFLKRPGCTVLPITTEPLSIALEGELGHLKLKFKPATGTKVMTVNFSGSECPAPSLMFSGVMACNYPSVETEATSHLEEFTATSGTKLSNGIENVELKGLDRFRLASGKLWSAH
ncbi:MAG TPA: hypothetical protein VGG08_02690 [Solirubrobacteraceae bacterium]|jgi:hypothetical protein